MADVTRVALVLTLDVGGDVPDPHNWAEAALRYRLSGERLGLGGVLQLPPRARKDDVNVRVTGIASPLAAVQSGALQITVRQPSDHMTRGCR